MIKTTLHSVIIICLFNFGINAQTDRTKVLILGTSHLNQIEKFEPLMLNTIIAKLDSFNFEVIGVEKMPGQLLYDIKSRNDKTFEGITDGGFGKPYLSLADSVQSVLNISFIEAESNINKILKNKFIAKNQRKELLFNFLIRTDLPSAVLQYKYLNNSSIFTTNFEKYINVIIEKNIGTNNEYYSLACPLAEIEGINRLESIDNFQDEALLLKYYPNFIKDFQEHASEIGNLNELEVYQKINQLTTEGIQSKDLSKLYTFINSDEYISQDYKGQWEIWLKTNFESRSDRARHALWEMRNMQISANIMNVVARNSGKKILIIIGSSHKGFIEKYLMQVKNIELLDY